MNRCDFKICDCALECVAESMYSVYLLLPVQILTQVLSLLAFIGTNVQILTHLALQIGRVAAAQHKSTDARLAMLTYADVC